jgi:hypothetical protein
MPKISSALIEGKRQEAHLTMAALARRARVPYWRL